MPSPVLRASIVCCAALVTAAGTRAQTPVTQPRVEAAIDGGIRALLEHYGRLHVDGATGRRRSGATALALYTLLKSGVNPADEVVRRMLIELASAPAEQTYDTACTLLALVAHDAGAHREWIDDFVTRLLAWQTDEGDWAYPGGNPDLSNTQFAALGLWAGARAGCEVPPRAWTALARATLRYEVAGGGFGYSRDDWRGKAQATASMTVAGVGTLALCEIQLRLAGALEERLARSIETARERGVTWMARSLEADDGRAALRLSHYTLYGLERAGTFLGTARLGSVDWYEHGARQLLETQLADGWWPEDAMRVETCFAVLFLRRATSGGFLGVPSGAAQRSSSAPLQLAVEGDGPLRVWIAGWDKRALRDLEWPRERGLGAHVELVEYFVDGVRAALKLGSPAEPARRERFADELHVPSAGRHTLRARATLRLPSGTTLPIESEVIEVTVVRALGGRDATPPRARADNLVPRMGPRVQVSSWASGDGAPLQLDFAPECAVDGNRLRPWLAAADDERRELVITFERAQKCAVLRVRAAVLEPLVAGELARPVSVRVALNGGDPLTLAMTPDPRRPVDLVLPARTSVRRIELSIPTVDVAGKPVGLGEVELYARAR